MRTVDTTSSRPGRLGCSAVAVLALVLAGCGAGATATQTVTVATTVESPTAGVAGRPPVVKPRRLTSPRVSPALDSQGYRSCDPNVKAKAATTTCGFAENAFWSYWRSGEAQAIRVYSPATGRTFATACTASGSKVVCRTRDKGVVKFPQAAVDSYTAGQAAHYAATRETHAPGTSLPRANPAPRDTPAPTYTPPAVPAPATAPEDDFCDTHNCIPNYPDGNGSTVQCADGTYSQSGGIQGACSHHGGVG